MEIENGKTYEVSLKFKVVDIENKRLGNLISGLDKFIEPFNWGFQQNGICIDYINVTSQRR